MIAQRHWILRLSGLIALLLLLSSGNPSPAHAAVGDDNADRVLGQAGFGTLASGSGLGNLNKPQGVAVDRSTGRIYVADRVNHRVVSWPNAATFTNGQAADISITSDGTSGLSLNPTSVAVDSNHTLYVADFTNNRVLVYNAPVTGATPASIVIGQPNMLGSATNDPDGAPANHNLNGPFGLAVDSGNNLYVADRNNNRVLKYPVPLATGMAADLVIGQPGMTSGGANNGGITASGLNAPEGLAVDSAGTLYVADTQNNRLLKYPASLGSGMAASIVVGQLDFASNSVNQGGASPTARTLNAPSGLAIDPLGSLYVADVNNNRVLGYRLPLSPGMAATLLFGQPDMTQSSANPGGAPAANSLWFPYSVATDNIGNVYVADYFNNRVLGFDGPFVWFVFMPFIRK